MTAPMLMGIARRSLMGDEGVRRSPILAVPAASRILGGIARKVIGRTPLGKVVGRLFTVPSAVRAARVVPGVLASALGGNVTAMRVLHERQYRGVEQSKAVWRAAYAQLPQAMKDLQFRRAKEIDPLIDHTGHETAAASALNNPLYVNGARAPGGKPSTRAQPEGIPREVEAGTLSHAEMVELGKRGRRDAGLSHAKVSRYDPETGRKRRVFADSLEAATWGTAKPFSQTATGKRTIRTAARVGATILTTGVPAFGGAVIAAGAAAGLGIAATAGAVVGALAAGFAIGTAINKLAARLAPDEVSRRKALAFRAARQRFAVDNGRPMTPQEVRDMGAGFLQSLSATTRRAIGR